MSSESVNAKKFDKVNVNQCLEFVTIYSFFNRLPKRKPKFLISKIESKQIIAFSKWKSSP
jgi:hypothetical protein